MNKEMNIENVQVNQKGYALLDHSENLLDTADICFSVDVPEEKEIAVTMSGEGTVRIYKNGVQAAELTLCGTEIVWTDSCIAGEKAVYFIDNADSITELDLHSNHITEFYVNRELPLRKLVIYDNALQQMDCSRLPQLQFLHMFDNPVCESEQGMKDTVTSLPDRTNMATGSVIFYPWIGLETLIQEITETDENGADSTRYVKYPYEPAEKANFSHPDNPHYHWLYENGSYKFEENRFYGIVSREATGDRIIGYGVYLNGELVKADSENCPEQFRKHQAYQNLRRNVLEWGTLAKNWVFGSAIMYHADWEKCPWDFRLNHVADMWETAEKGFGLTLGTWEQMTLMFPGSRYLNVVRFQDCQKTPQYCDFENIDTADEVTKKYIKLFLQGKISHGDRILSIICGNGAEHDRCPGSVTGVINNVRYTYDGAIDDQRYGYVPLCKLQLLEKNIGKEELSGVQQINKFSNMTGEEWGCDSITSSTGFLRLDLYDTVFEELNDTRKNFTDYSSTHIMTVSTGNSGDGEIYTNDTDDTYYYDAAYGTNNMSMRSAEEGTEKIGVIFASGLDREKRVPPNIQNSPAAERAKFTTVDFMTQYGQFVMTHKNLITTDENGGKKLVGRLGYLHGTSYSSPILNAMLMLLRIIYTKMIMAKKQKDSPENAAQWEEMLESFGKYSPFMDHVREHWCDRLPNLMDSASGYGMVDVLAEPVHNRFLNRRPAAGHTDRFQVGEPIRFLYDADATKDGFTVEYDREMFALTAQNVLYPIRPTEETQDVVLYSNSARQTVTDGIYNDNYYKTTFSFPAVAENSALEIAPEETVENDSQDFTVFLLLDFLSAFSGEDVWFIKAAKEDEPYMCMEVNKGLADPAEGLSRFKGKRLKWSICDGNVELGDEFVCYPMENYLSKHGKVVLAITNSEDGMVTYFNGNRTSFIPSGERFPVRYEHIVLSGNETAVHRYARCMSEEEIIRNTAAILAASAADNNENA